MLDTEFKYYVVHQKELLDKYAGKFIVIKEENVIGAYVSQMEAYNETLKTEKLGTFLIQHCIPGTQSYTHTFHSRVLL